MSIEVRDPAPDDIERVVEIAHDAWHEAHAPIVGAPTVEQFLAKYYDNESMGRLLGNDAIFVVGFDGDLVGFAVSQPREEFGFELGRRYVDPPRWGTGVGTRLLDTVAQRVRECGGDLIRLGVMAENERAISFYEHRGYERIGERYDDRIDTMAYNYQKEP